jgi:hypothetical protein
VTGESHRSYQGQVGERWDKRCGLGGKTEPERENGSGREKVGSERGRTERHTQREKGRLHVLMAGFNEERERIVLGIFCGGFDVIF